ncbi:hypothetical protein D9M68_187780 [compost metagenome]
MKRFAGIDGARPLAAISDPLSDDQAQGHAPLTGTSAMETGAAVFVHYGNRAAAERFEQFIRNRWPRWRVIAVDTASVETPHLNRAFEFSGYRHGIEVASRDAIPGQTLRVLLCNDTIFTAHDWNYVRSVTSTLQNLTVTGRAIIGCAEQTPLDTPTACTQYFPTFLFAVQGTAEELLSLRMHDGVFDNAQAWEPIWRSLPAAYRQCVDRWLKPTSFLKGWYQAIPGRPLPSETLFRKRFAIFQEHTLVGRARDSGFAIVDLCVGHPWLKLGRLLDRIRGNLRKWHFRLASVLNPRPHL